MFNKVTQCHGQWYMYYIVKDIFRQSFMIHYAQFAHGTTGITGVTIILIKKDL
jgi:hypothetical protein